MTIAIIEDETAHQDILASYIEAWSRTAKQTVSIRCYENAGQFLFAWEDEQPDVVFVDIQMPGMNGIELAKRLRTQDQELVIIFTTGLADYMEEGYEVEALHYLLKPIQPEKVAACMEKASRKRTPREYCLVHTEDGQLRKISVKEIDFVEACKHKSVLGLAFGERLMVRESFSELSERLSGKGFVKCHRSYLCQLERICQIEREELLFDDGSRIPISRRLYQEVNQRFIAHFRRIEGERKRSI